MTDPGQVVLEIKELNAGSIAELTISRPAKLNAITPQVIEDLILNFRQLSEMDELRAVILRGAGKRAFTAGADIHILQSLDKHSAVKFITQLHNAIEAIRLLPAPVIARISGYCFGAGMEIAAGCDLRAADHTATFSMPEVRVGIPSVIEAVLLPDLIGWGKTRELLLTGRQMTAEEALQAGFVQSLCDPRQLDDRIQSWIDDILLCGPGAVKLQKKLISNWEQSSRDTSIVESITDFAQAYETDEPHRYMASALETLKTKTKN